MPASGAYATIQDVYNVFGSQNVIAWSDADSTGTEDVTREQAAFNAMDSFIQSFFSQFGNYSIPLQPIGVSVQLVTYWSAVLVGAYLYRARGLRDVGDGDGTGDHITGLDKLVKAQMYEFAAKRLLQANLRWPAPSAPTPSLPWRNF